MNGADPLTVEVFPVLAVNRMDDLVERAAQSPHKTRALADVHEVSTRRDVFPSALQSSFWGRMVNQAMFEVFNFALPAIARFGRSLAVLSSPNEVKAVRRAVLLSTNGIRS